MGAGEVHFGEVAADVYTQSLVYVDCMSNAEHELQGLPQPLGMHELGSTIIKGNYPGEHSVTIFQSMGKYGTSFAICRKYLVLILSVILVFSHILSHCIPGMASEDACVAEAVQNALLSDAK